MKALLICPADRTAVAQLAAGSPLVLRPLLGRPLLAWWLEQFAQLGARELILAAADRPHQVQGFVGSGERWGLRIQVLPQSCELSLPQARAMYHPNGETDWMARPNDVVLLDHLPSLPQHRLFGSYRAWFAGAIAALRRFDPTNRTGWHEHQPGVWVGPRVRLAASARLVPPCWIGGHCLIGAQAVIGPLAVLEDKVVVERGSRIHESIVAPETFVGAWTELHQVLVDGSQLLSWRHETSLQVNDEFLLASLPVTSPRPWQWHWRGWLKRWRSQHRRLASPLEPGFDHRARSVPGDSAAKQAT